MARTRSKDRCPRCYIRRVLCLCDLAPRFSLATKVILILHKRETRRPTNSGRLLQLTLENMEVRVRGEKDAPMSGEGLVVEGRQTLLLYPSEKAVPLTPQFVASLTKPIQLVVPDGSWRQASKVMNREPVLRDVLHVKVPDDDVSSALRLRKETKTGGMATFEAVAKALGVLENRNLQQSLENFFKINAERILWSRARLSAEDCENEIPQAAIESHGQIERAKESTC